MCLIRDVSQRKNLKREVIEIALLEQRRIGQNLHDECGQQLTALALLADSLVDSLDQNLPAEAEKTRAIAEELHLSVKTVETYRDRIRRKLDLPERGDLDRYALQWALENR